MSWISLFAITQKIASITAIISFLILIKQFIIIWHMEKRRKDTLKTFKEEQGRRPAFLIVDIGEHSIRSAVEDWLQGREEFKEFIKEENFYHVNFNKRKIDENDIDNVIDEFRKKRGEIFNRGVNKIHLFYRGPVAIATMIGAELSNGCPVSIYHNDSNTTYINWGPLQRW